MTNLLPASRTFVARMIPSIVEEVLRVGVVDGDHGEAQRAVTLERLQADHARGRLLRTRDDVRELFATSAMENTDHVGPIVHRQLRLVVDGRLDMRVVRVVVLAFDREDGNVVFVDERCGDVVLRRQRIRRAKDDVCAAGLQCPHEIRRLRRDVQARRDAVAGERLFLFEALADRGEHRHLPVGPGDSAHALGSERQILHVMPFGRSHALLFSVVRRRAAARACAAPSRAPRAPFRRATYRRRRGEPVRDGAWRRRQRR